MVNAHLHVSDGQIAAFCRKWGISELALFGSVLRDDFTPDSDVDVLFKMKPESAYGFLEYFDMKWELEKLFGRPVDFVSRQAIDENPNWIRRREILSTAKAVYAD